MRSLIDEIAHSVIAPPAKKRLFSGPYLPFQRYLGCYQIAFETGVVLGYAFRSRLTTLAKLFSQPSREQELVTFMQGLAGQHLAKAGEPKDFLQLAMWYEDSRIKGNWHEEGINEVQMEYLTKHQKVPLEQAFKNLHVAVSTGIGFGSAFPGLTEKLWKVAYERPIDLDEWQKWKRAGLDLGDELPEPFPLEKRQEQILSQVELFVSKSRPELLSQFRI